MSKRRKVVIPALLAIFALAGCSGENADSKDNGSNEPSSSKVTTRAKLVKLEAKTNPTKTEYFEGEVFDTTGLTLTASYDNDTTKEIKSGFSASTDPLALGQTSVTVTYSTKSVDVPVTVKALTVKSFALTTTNASLKYATKNAVDLSGLEFTVTYNNDTTKVISVLDEGVTMKDERGNDFVNGALGSTLGTGAHTITVTYKELTATVNVDIFIGYKIEGEAASNEENPTADSYVKAKVNDEYVSIVTGRDTGNGSICGIKEATASGGQFLGGIKAGNVIEFYFKSEAAGKADVKIAASSNWVLKFTSDNKPLWTGDMQVNEVFTATANDNPVTIADSVVLEGSGSEDNTIGDYKLYRKFKEINFGEMNVVEGLNKVVISMMTSDVMSAYENDSRTGKPKYQNAGTNNNFGVPAIDYLQVDFQA